MWDAALPSYGEGVRYSPWIFTLVVNNQDKEGKAAGGKAGPELSELRQQALLEQLQGCDKLPRHLRQPDKVRRDGSAPLCSLSLGRLGQTEPSYEARVSVISHFRLYVMINNAAAADSAYRVASQATPADIKTLMLDIAAEESYRPKRTGYMFPRYKQCPPA